MIAILSSRRIGTEPNRGTEEKDMNEKNLFGDDIERDAFEADTTKRAGIARVTQDALTPVVVLLIVSPTLIGTCFI